MNTLFKRLGVAVFVSAFALPFGAAHAESTDGVITRIEYALDQPASLDFEGLLAKARQDGAVCVIVELDFSKQTEALLKDSQAIEDQRNAIAMLQQTVLNELDGYNIKSVKQFKTIPFLAMEVDPDALELLGSLPGVKAIGEDVKVPPSVLESIPLVGADQAHASGFSGDGQVVAILDTGVDKNHPFLNGKVVAEACFSFANGDGKVTSLCPNGKSEFEGDGAAAPCSLNGCDHGTHVAGIAAGSVENGTGVAPDANIVAIQVFSQYNDDADCGMLDSAPCIKTPSSNYAYGLEYVHLLKTEHGMNVSAANLSLGAGHYENNCDADPNLSNDASSRMVAMAVDNLYSDSIATIAASGNDGEKLDESGNLVPGIHFPACLSKVVSVGNTTKDDNVNPSSQSDPSLDLLAPGTDIVSSVPGGYDVMTGSSMAAPHVAGAWAVLKAQNPDASVPETLYALRNSGLELFDHRHGVTTPRIQVDAALDFQANASYLPLDQLSPVNATIEERPAYIWGASHGAEWYYLYVADSSGNVISEGYVDPGYAGCGKTGQVCAITRTAPEEALAAGQYNWWVAGGNADGYKWSRGVSFERR